MGKLTYSDKKQLKSIVRIDFRDRNHTTKFVTEMIEDETKGWEFFNKKWKNQFPFLLKRHGMFNIINSTREYLETRDNSNLDKEKLFHEVDKITDGNITHDELDEQLNAIMNHEVNILGKMRKVVEKSITPEMIADCFPRCDKCCSFKGQSYSMSVDSEFDVTAVDVFVCDKCGHTSTQ